MIAGSEDRVPVGPGRPSDVQWMPIDVLNPSLFVTSSSRGSPNWMCSSLSASPGEMASTRARRSASHVDSNRLSTNPVVDLPLEGRTFGAAGSRSELGFRKAGNA